MPSGHLYSTDDGDDESFTEELTPTDGYFEPNRMPSDHTVLDPSIDMKTEPKTLIPPPSTRQQHSNGSPSTSSIHELFSMTPPMPSDASIQSTTNVPPPRTYTPISPVQHEDEGIFPEHMPLMNGPPPAYTPSPAPPVASRSTPLNPSSGRIYSTFPEQYLEQGLFTNREPESMVGTTEEPNERTPLSTPTVVISRRRKIGKSICLALILGTITFTLLLTMFYKRTLTDHDSDMPGFPDRPLDAKDPYCAAAKNQTDQVTYEFPVGSDISLIQTTYADDGESIGLARVKTAGEIRLRKLPKDSKHGTQAYFTIDVHVSDPELEVLRTWDEGARVLKVSTPRYARLDTRGPHCVSLEITAWIPEGASFNNILVEAITLSLRVLPDAKVSVSGRSKFSTVSGRVIFPSIDQIERENPGFASRRIVVETISDSISGGFPLFDLLAISSQSGSVTVDVAPQPVLESAPLPADLEVQTASGGIRVNLPVDLGYIPPPRNYITRIHSSSAHIDGSYYLGSLSNFRTTAGSIKITTLPVLPDTNTNLDARSNVFETHTISGSTDVEVLDPIFFASVSSPLLPKPVPRKPSHSPYLPIGDADPYLPIDESDPYIPPSKPSSSFPSSSSERKSLRSLDAKHSSSSASVSVIYPYNWEGTIHAKTVSGQITTKGELRVVRSRDGPAFKEVLARKGVSGDQEGGLVDMSDIAGSLGFEVRSAEEVVKRR